MMMEFEDEHDEEEEEDTTREDVNEDDDDDDDVGEGGGDLNLTPPHPYKFELKKHQGPPPTSLGQGPPPNQQHSPGVLAYRYRECLKNHAVTIGGHAVDGCGEFMPAGPDGSLDALKCAACNCHRNFHRKELLHHHNNNHQQLTIFTPRPHNSYHPSRGPLPTNVVYPFYRGPSSGLFTPPAQARPLALPSSGGGDSDNTAAGVAEDGVIGGMATMTVTSTSSGKKRHRTKFTPEQKDKMLSLAEQLGWKIQKQDEGVVQEFCDETGVKRHVLKVWMHNNKHTLGKKP